ncbi:MAG: FAD binding domain-containing protein [Alphaproteobacteria bacterium]|nr:FAD binding domain-containing protein [Alphaproteobacteria bacterium]
MKSAPFQYHAPARLDDALAVLAETAGDDGRVIAGGQSLVPMMAFRLAMPGHLVDINRIEELAGVEIQGDTLSIRALARHACFHRPVIDHPFGRMLTCVAGNIAHYPVRMRGTFCGSLANADPASEWCLVAATFDAELELHSRSGVRTVPAREFALGAMTTALRPEEILTLVRLPIPPEQTQMGFYEFNRRAGDFALGMGLVSYRLEEGVAVDVRIGLGGIEETPRRLGEAEGVIAGQFLSETLIEAAAEAAAGGVDPIEDSQTTPAYRRDLARTVIKRAFDRAGRL